MELTIINHLGIQIRREHNGFEENYRKNKFRKLYDNYIEQYQLGNFTEGVCEWNGDDALMGPKSVAHKFKKICRKFRIHI